MGIKRYDIDDSIEYRGFLLENNAGGSLVSYSDYAALEAERDALREEIKAQKKRIAEYNEMYKMIQGEVTILRSVIERAREYVDGIKKAFPWIAKDFRELILDTANVKGKDDE